MNEMRIGLGLDLDVDIEKGDGCEEKSFLKGYELN